VPWKIASYGYIAFDELEARGHDCDQKGNPLNDFTIIFEGDRATAAKNSGIADQLKNTV
jgi:hypothetical protein